MEEFLSKKQIEHFITNGFVRIDNAFSSATAEEAREILWLDMNVNRHDRATWTKPVIWLGMYSQKPFTEAANTPVLHQAFDQLIGPGKWIPCNSMGTFPVRFPSPDDPGDTGWHVDASFPGSNPDDYFSWRINYRSKNRALLMLFLFSDTGTDDAPTRIREGSHLHVARLLEPYGAEGLSFMELARKLKDLPESPEVLATGNAGTVYLCHPLLVHAAQWHRGKEPRFMAQPPLLLREDLLLDEHKADLSPLETSILTGLHR